MTSSSGSSSPAVQQPSSGQLSSLSPEPQLSSASGGCNFRDSCNDGGGGGRGGGGAHGVSRSDDAARQLIVSISGSVEAGRSVLEEVRSRLRPVAGARTATAAASAAFDGDFRSRLRHPNGAAAASSSSGFGLADNFEAVIRLTRQRLRPAAEGRRPSEADAAAAATAAAAAADPEDEAALWGSPDFADLLRHRRRSLRPAQEAPSWIAAAVTSQTSHQPPHQPPHQPTHQPPHQPLHQPPHQPLHQPPHQPTHQPTHQPPQLGDTDTDSQADSEILDSVSAVGTPATTTEEPLQLCEAAEVGDAASSAGPGCRSEVGDSDTALQRSAAAAALAVSTSALNSLVVFDTGSLQGEAARRCLRWQIGHQTYRQKASPNASPNTSPNASLSASPNASPPCRSFSTFKSARRQR
ncbi:hypothetical protein BOX15_Mlig018673g1 [Macrostomum lignano]|uniref:Uncharacterized protein n=1 Tax=Macrostomum lignano TaxID=282301 RepID=A0A267FK20_9PLAT|nr:hypothetical protein BOX15_Mlig018673g1 [Macrostomum lignano]